MRSVWFETATAPDIPAEDFEAEMHYDTVVAGAGLTGMATAVLLARAGHQVAVLEAREMGAVTTGSTTGKVSLLQGAALSQISRFHTSEVVQSYVDSNLAGMEWLLAYLADRGIDYQRRTAYSYSTTSRGAATLRAELIETQSCGLATRWIDSADLPFAITGAIALEDQAQLNAVDAVRALAAELRDLGGTRVEGVRVTGTSHGHPLTIRTTRGDVRADRLVLATGTPILDRGAYFAKLSPQRSYVSTYRIPDAAPPLPSGMYLSVDDPTRSIRTVPQADGTLLLVGGNGHTVGRSSSPQAAIADLERWVHEHFPGAQRTHTWSAQDYRSVNMVPFVGALPRGGGRTYLATGYNKWGMTNSVAAAMALSGEILGSPPSWAKKLGRRATKPTGLLESAEVNAEVGWYLTKGWAAVALTTLPAGPPAEGDGVVGRDGLQPAAISTVEGITCDSSAVCTHLGGILNWNDAEKSWDCPLHGSRFAADGVVLEGPAVKNLPRRERER